MNKNKIDKYTIAAEIKNENPAMTHKEAMEIAKEVERIHLDSNGSFDEAMDKAREILEKKVEK